MQALYYNNPYHVYQNWHVYDTDILVYSCWNKTFWTLWNEVDTVGIRNLLTALGHQMVPWCQANATQVSYKEGKVMVGWMPAMKGPQLCGIGRELVFQTVNWETIILNSAVYFLLFIFSSDIDQQISQNSRVFFLYSLIMNYLSGVT